MSKKATKSNKKTLEIIIAIIVMILGVIFGYDYLVNEEEPTEIDFLEYYAGCENLTGNELKNKLHEIINNDFIALNYGKAKEVLADADVDPNDDTKVLTIYSRESVNRIWDGESWHREHVWPNSRLGLERVEEHEESQASDLHNLRAIVQKVNSSRGNKPYADGSGKYGRVGDGWYPGDEDKGDVARICFYMTIMYPFLELVDEELNDDNSYLPEGAKMGELSVLLKWHKEDPVDDFERHRNEVIFQAQKNRNPFIDHPELVNHLFKSNNSLSNTNEQPVYYYIVIPECRKKEEII